MKPDPEEELGLKMDALGVWDRVARYNWSVRPHGTVLPYFCTLLRGDGKPVRVRFLMLEGWQTFHAYMQTRADRNFGFYTTPMEMAHFELVVADGACRVFRHDPGFMPRPLEPSERDLVHRILWESYGIMLRLESDEKLPMRYAEDKALFSRVETSPGEWSDAPLPLVDPRPYTEQVAISKADIKAAKDLPFVRERALELDFRLYPALMTKEPRARCCYRLLAIDAETGATVIDRCVSAGREGGLKAMWEQLPGQVLKALVVSGRMPGEIRVLSGRVFRFLRALCVELPLKLSLRDELPRLEAAFRR